MSKKSNVNIPAIQIIRTIVFLFIAFIIFITYTRTVNFLTTSKLFEVHDVFIDSSIQFMDLEYLRRLKGRNIFNIDINKLEAKIKAQYPQISDLRVIRELPDVIKVLAKKREATAQVVVKGKLLLVDNEGVILYYVPAPLALPLVQGAVGSSAKIVPGTVLEYKPVTIALHIIQVFKLRIFTGRLKISSIDVTNLSKIDLTLSGGWHVILDQDHFETKLEMLEMMLAQKKVDFAQVKYIDLRFNEPVLSEHEQQSGK